MSTQPTTERTSNPPSQTPSLVPPRLRSLSVERLVRIACYGSLLSMGLMGWSVVDPTPFPVMISMSVGQAIGTVALLCYTVAVLLSQGRHRDKGPGTSSPPPRLG